jgi:hypothetical protein
VVRDGGGGAASARPAHRRERLSPLQPLLQVLDRERQQLPRPAGCGRGADAVRPAKRGLSHPPFLGARASTHRRAPLLRGRRRRWPCGRIRSTCTTRSKGSMGGRGSSLKSGASIASDATSWVRRARPPTAQSPLAFPLPGAAQVRPCSLAECVCVCCCRSRLRRVHAAHLAWAARAALRHLEAMWIHAGADLECAPTRRAVARLSTASPTPPSSAPLPTRPHPPTRPLAPTLVSTPRRTPRRHPLPLPSQLSSWGACRH